MGATPCRMTSTIARCAAVSCDPALTVTPMSAPLASTPSRRWQH